MSAFDIIKRPIEEIKKFLDQHGAILRNTEIPNTYLVKFTEATKVADPEINQLKGLIFNHHTGKVISLTYPVPVEVKDLSPEQQLRLVADLDGLSATQATPTQESSTQETKETKETKESKTPITVQECPDGSLLRLSFLPENKEWLISSNSKEHAKTSYWMNNVSLEEQFKSTVDYHKIDFAKLNPDYVYLFVMCHQLNIIVVNHTESRLYHVATYDRTTGREIQVDIGLPTPKVYQMTASQVNLVTREATQKPVESAGYMILRSKDGIVQRYRFENANYTRAKVLRGNSNNIDFTLLNLAGRHPDESQDLNEFLQYYPMYVTTWMQIRERLGKLIAKIYHDYCVRHKERRYWVVHHRHHNFIEEIHEKLYKSILRPECKTVRFSDVEQYLLHQPAAKILWMLNYIYDRSPSRAAGAPAKLM